MNFEDKLDNIYQEIANNANQIIPDEWKNIFMESEVTEDGGSVYFFYTLKKRGRFFLFS
ncbi:immunity protein YezG family protein [Staphylococcus warneri]